MSRQAFAPPPPPPHTMQHSRGRQLSQILHIAFVGHGKGPWDGLGAVLKQTITRDITNDNTLTPSGRLHY
eukprot:5959505-Pleurochrysis_carterae.AAC.3